MKRKLITARWVIVLALIGILAGAGADRMLPELPGISFVSAASAAEMSIKPMAPLAPLTTPTGTGFTYQGSLKSGGNPAAGNYDFAFHMFDDPSVGSQVGVPITFTNQTVTAGLFTVSLDFGSSAFDGNARYMEISVRQSGGGGYNTLSPRQPISPAPYALFALKTTPYKNVVVVAKSGGQFTSIQAALNSITDASTTNHYLVWVGPGTYSERVTMKQYVDIEGAGEQSTKITFTASPGQNTGTVLGASNAELRSLTVENTGSNSFGIAIYNSGVSPSLLHVTAIASGATNDFGVFNTTTSSSMTNVTASASGNVNSYGVYNTSSSSSMTNVTASASSAALISYGVFSSGASTVTINNSKIMGATNAIANNAGSSTLVGTSQLSGGPVFNDSTLICTASYNSDNKRLGAQCTPDTNTIYVAPSGGDFTSIATALTSITDNSASNRYIIKVGPGTYTEQVTMKQYVDIEGAGEQQTKITFTGSPGQNTGTVLGAGNVELRSLTVENTGGNNYAIAIYNSGASPSLKNVTVLASGASIISCGINNVASSSPTMTNVTAYVTGGTDNRGVLNDSSSPRIMGSVISTSGGTFGFGVSSYTGGIVTIDSSKITGNTNTVFNSAATTRVGASQLSGGPVSNNSGGTLTCSASYDENYNSPGLNVCP